MHNRVLVVGLSATGKSYLAAYFKRKGKHSYDTDKLELSHWVDKRGHVAKYIHTKYHDEEYLSKYKWRWDKTKFKKLLKVYDEVYFFGSADNETEFYKYFDRVYFLKANKRLLSIRLKKRGNKDHFGATEQQRRLIYSWIDHVEKRAKEEGLKFIDASLSPSQIFRIICKEPESYKNIRNN
jgi:hypothetical protein